MKRKQLTVFLIMLVVYALCAFVTYAFFMDQMISTADLSMPKTGASPVLMGLANAAIVLVIYGLVGLAGYWFARKLEFPGIYSEGGDIKRLFFIPLGLGIICAVFLVVGDIILHP